jgi:hypothetical protein
MAARVEALGWGRMWVARNRNIYTYPGEFWGLDNGAFADRGEFDSDAFQKVLDKAVNHHTPPNLAVLPDIVAGGHRSLELSLSWLDRVPDFPWYLAVQDGIEPDDVDPSLFAGIFLGGSNAYKATAGTWCEWAHSHGFPCHYGRAGTQEKVRHALNVSADSLDSAFPMWTRARWHLFTQWIARGPCQTDLFWNDTPRRRHSDY